MLQLDAQLKSMFKDEKDLFFILSVCDYRDLFFGRKILVSSLRQDCLSMSEVCLHRICS